MTETQATPDAAPAPAPPTASPGRVLLTAAAVLAGSLLLLWSIVGPFIMAWAAIVPGLTFVPQVGTEAVPTVLLLWGAGVALVVAGLLATRGPLAGRIAGAVVVVLGAVAVPVIMMMRTFGDLRLDPTATMVLGNPWALIVFAVGVGWLLARGARLGWLTLLAVVPLVPTPLQLVLAGSGYAVLQAVLWPLAVVALVVILLLGRSLRH